MRKGIPMFTDEFRSDFCCICKHEEASIFSEPVSGIRIFICDDCLEAAKYNFIFICMNCGKAFLRSKKQFLQKIKDPKLLRAYRECEHMQIIQGIDMCIACDPEGIYNYLRNERIAGHC